MKAVVYTQYGPPEVLQFANIEKPSPKANEMLIKIHATTVSAVDSNFRRGDGFAARMYAGLRKPTNTILGGLLAGEIEAVGKDVTMFKPGDRVFGGSGNGFGTYSEYVCVPENGIITTIPNGIPFEDAACIPEALTALYFLRSLAKTRSGQKVLINGASGAIGTYAIQLARHFGAHVTGVSSAANMSLVKSLGADHVIDYTSEDFTRNTNRYDVIFDVVAKSSFSRSKKALSQGGLYLTTVMSPGIIWHMAWTSRMGSKKAILGLAGLNQKPEDLLFLKERLEAGQLKSVIDRCYPLDQIAEAHRYVDTGHKKGNVVITIAQPS
jgi:NADPH:quinone reductase-like Zn-dependent oxidoreductase